MEVHLFSPQKTINHFCIGKVKVIMMYAFKCFKFKMLIKKKISTLFPLMIDVSIDFSISINWNPNDIYHYFQIFPKKLSH